MGNPVVNTANGVLMHVLAQKQERTDDEGIESQIDKFKGMCASSLAGKGALVQTISSNAFLAFFPGGTEACLSAADCADKMRAQLSEFRGRDAFRIVLKISIVRGDVTSVSTDAAEPQFSGKSVDDSFNLVTSTHPMQITLSEDVFEVVKDSYHVVSRCPVDIGEAKPVPAYYLHTNISQPTAL